MNQHNQTGRIVYFDYLKVFAAFAVMILHISAQNWYTTDVNESAWQIYNFFNSMVRWAVPVFVMISGALFLNRKIRLKIIYSKYILRLVIAFVVWSLVYAILINGSVTHRIESFIMGYYHMWFILMIAGLYVCLPFIKPIAEKNDRCIYFLILSVIFAFVTPEFLTLANDFGNNMIIKGADAVGQNLRNMNMHMVLGYTGYFVLGHYINNISLRKILRVLIYFLGICGFLSTAGLTLLVSLRNQNYCDHYYGYFTINVFFEALAVFVWFKYRTFNREGMNAFVQRLAKISFGAYLIHVIVIEQLDLQLGLNTLSFHPAISIICIGGLTFIISFIASAILNQIPFINKYIV